MPQVRAAAGAEYLRASHAVTCIRRLRDASGADGSREARPSGTGVELVGGLEQWLAAADAAIAAGLVVRAVLS